MRNKTGQWAVKCGILLLAMALGAALDAFGFKPPSLPRLPDVDNRPLPAVVGHGAALASAAPVAEQALLPALRVDRDTFGRPQFVRARSGFLTGPDGAGGMLSATAVSAFAAGDPDRGLKAFLREHAALFGHGPEALAEARVTRETVGPHNGMRSVTWQQQVDGIPVFEAVLTAHTTKKGELVNVAGRFLPALPAAADAGTPARASLMASPSFSAAQSIRLAAASIGVILEESAVGRRGPPAAGPDRAQPFTAPGLAGEARTSLVWLPVNPAALRLCWDVILTGRDRGEMFRVLIDAETGATWLRRCLTVYADDASYRVFTGDSPSPFSPGLSTPGSTQPPEVARSLVTFSALSTNASPDGWIPDGDNTTQGNNVDAHLDGNADDIPDTGSRPTGFPFRVFDFALDLAQPPSAYTQASVAQLFYLNNWMHDRLYDLGFTESAGNFQADNFGRGGASNDAVQADAQDGSGFNNANFSTPPDGLPPRMQMYVFTGPAPDRDGDLDAEVVLHEYTHGLSNRRVGGGVGITALQTEGMGEGWSDFYPLSLLGEAGDDPDACYPCGAYASYLLGSGFTQNYYYGIRRYPYSTDMTKNPLTFKDIDPAQAGSHGGVPLSPIGGGSADEVHNMGEVWCVTLWEARTALVKKHGWATGNALMLQLVTDGMALCPVNPNFLQARDAIIQADEVDTGGANYRELWMAFAKRGMGAGATSPDSSTTEGLQEAYDMPDDLQVTPARGWDAAGYFGGPFSPTSAVYTLRNKGADPVSWTAAAGAGWISLSATNGVLAPGGSHTVMASLNSAIAVMAVGDYAGTLVFSNAASGVRQPLTIRLTIKDIPGKIGVTDTIFPVDDTNLPFGDVMLGCSRGERIMVTNRDLAHDLVISGIGFGCYEEDFNDGLAQDWTPDPAPFWAVTNGEYRAQAIAVSRFMQSVFMGEQWVDCTARVTMKRTGYAYNSAVLVLRAGDTFSAQASRGSAYLIGVTPAGYYYVGKYNDGRFSFLQYWSWSPYLSAATNVVEGQIRGNRISVYFNGQLAISGTDDSIPGPGRVALLGYSQLGFQTVHYFDNITVGQWASGGSVSGAQRWFNEHPCPGGDPAEMPPDWTPPSYPGGGEPGGKTGSAGFRSKISGSFRLDMVPDLPLRLAPGAGFTLDLAFEPVRTETNQNTVVIFSNDADTPALEIPLIGNGIVNPMEVLPAAGLSARGRYGGPFSPSGTVYTVTNRGGAVLAWTAASAFSWTTVAPLSGTLAAGESACVTVLVNNSATWLPEGIYSNAVEFKNLAVWGVLARSVLLTVGRYPVLDLEPRSFGMTNIAGSRTVRNLTVSNRGDTNLVWLLRLPNDGTGYAFESGEDNWTHSGMNDGWHLSTNRSASGAWAWYCGTDPIRQYANSMNASLISPPLLLRSGARLSFRHWYVTEASFDYGYVELSTNNGVSYAALASFTGTNVSWAASSCDLSAFAGKTVLIRFRFRSDSIGSAFEGWYVDDVQVSPVAVSAGNVVTANPVEGVVPPGTTANAAITFDSAGMTNGAVRTGDLALVCNDPRAPSNTLPYFLRIVPPLTVTIPASATEGDGLLAAAGRLTLPDVLAADLPVHLVSSDPGEVMVPDVVTIPAGLTNALFDLTVLDDREVDGRQPITISALGDRFGSAVIAVADNESTNLTLALPARGYEGEVFTNGGRVMLGGTWPSDLTVSLQSDDPSEATVPATVTVPAGATMEVFTVSLPLDGISDGIRTSRVAASAAAFGSGSAFMETQDRDVHHFAISAVASPQKAGLPFRFSVAAKNVQGGTIAAFREDVGLSASGKAGAVSLQPAHAPFVNGEWAGLVSANTPDLNVRITVGAGRGYAGKSNPFEVRLGSLDHFAWRPVASPQNVNYPFSVTLIAQDAANNTVTGFAGTVALAAITGGWNSTNLLGEGGFVSTNAGFRTAGIRFTPARPLIVTHLRRFWGVKVSIWKDNGVLMASKTFSGADGNWQEAALDTPLQLQAGTTYRLAAYAPGSPCFLRDDETPAGFPDGTVAGGCYSDAGDAFPDRLSGARFLADLRYSPDVTRTVRLSPVNSGHFIKGVWSGSVTVKAMATNLCLKAADASGHAGISRLFNVGALSLFLRLPPVVWEGNAVLANAGTVTLSRAVSTNVVVTLASGDTTELKAPARLTVPAGKTSVSFNLTVVDDGIADGPQSVPVTASLPGYVPAAATVEVRPAVVKKPAMIPAGGKFDGTRLVTLTCATADARIRYTSDGSEVTESASLYGAPIELTQSCTLKAKAFKATAIPSATVEGVFVKVESTVVQNNTALFSLASEAGTGHYYRIDLPALATNLQISISGGTGDCDLIVRYGAIPETNAYDYFPAQSGNSETVTVTAPRAGVWYALLLAGPEGYEGVRLLVTYQIQPPPPDPPVIVPAGGIHVGSILVSMTCATPDAAIRYTLDGTEPASNSAVYTSPVKLDPAPVKTVKAKASKEGRGDSETVVVVYKICGLLRAGKPVVVSGKKGRIGYFAIKLTAKTARLSIRLAAGSGDADLYVRKSLLPTAAVYDQKSVMAGNNELITIANPQPNKWYYIMLKGKTAYQQAILLATPQ